MAVAVATARVAKTIQGIQREDLITVRWHWGGRGSCGGGSAGGQDDSGNPNVFLYCALALGSPLMPTLVFHALIISWE